MSHFHLYKTRFNAILFTFFLALQITACTTDENLTTNTENTSSEGNINTDTDTDTNHAAIITGIDYGNLTEESTSEGTDLLEVSGKLNISDTDTNEASFIEATVNGAYGSLMMSSTGDWTYVASNNQPAIQNLDNGETLTDSLIINSIDGTSHTIIITINGVDETNIPAIITGASNGDVTEDVDPDNDGLLEVSAKLNITDSNAGEDAFVAETVNGSFGELTINSTGTWHYTANNNQSAIQNLGAGASITDNLIIRSLDGTTHTITINILGVNEASSTVNITLTWTAPVEREDNSTLTLSEIAGYKVYYGSMQGQYDNSININDGNTESYTFTDFPADTYYFVITTVDTEGRESQYSTEVSITN
ncbi:MAG: hypothetical protein COB77_06260 [Gammaproteobacteria bacterium]|nr:MAG: hypothetical protein COB77_06260 [Gammaproteobacteria bacterium]